jgi:hypothetical protein
VAGKPLKMGNYYSINPDCSSLGQPTVRVAEQPKHGRLEISQTTDFPYFSEGNVRHACNTRRVPVMQMTYIPDAGYNGSDSFQTDVVYASGQNQILRYRVEVR